MPRFLSPISEDGNSVPTSSNDTIADIVYLTQTEFESLVSQNKLVENTIYMVDESSGGNKLNGCPIGAIVMWGASRDTIPDGWTVCDGSAIPSSADDRFKQLYPNKLPDLAGFFPVGVNDETNQSGVSVDPDFAGIGNTGGSRYIQEHFHSPGTLSAVSNGTHNHLINGGTSSDGDHQHRLPTNLPDKINAGYIDYFTGYRIWLGFLLYLI